MLDWIFGFDEPVIILDKLTYAGNLDSLFSLRGKPWHIFVQGVIGDRALLDQLLAEHRPRAVINFAAESHVDRSIHGPGEFIQTNIVGTYHLLEAVRAYWSSLPLGAVSDRDKKDACGLSRSSTVPTKDGFLFLHVSTDELYGALAKDDPVFAETNLYEPNPVFGQQERQRPPGARLAPHLRPAGDHHQLL